MIEYRCKNCNDLLFKGKLKNGSQINIMCKKRIKREVPEKSVNWSKCRTLNIFGMEE